MAKLGIYADAHFSLNSSVVVGSKNSLSGRLTYLVESFEWMYKLFQQHGVETIIDLGDLADSYNLRAEEITAISKALSANPGIGEIHILGNHERLSKSGKINSVEFLSNIPDHWLITDVSQEDVCGVDVTFIPYGIYEDGCFDDLKKTSIAFSHIDIFGADTGGWSLKSGLSPDYIAKRFKLTLNGHIHNGSWVIKDKILNVGSISGQNFSSKILNWKPSVVILDTETLNVEFFENPYALNFYTQSFQTVSDVVKFVNGLKGERNVLQVKVPLSISDDVKEVLGKSDAVLASRLNINVDSRELDGIDHGEIETLSSVEGGFSKLADYINEQKELPYNRDDILSVISDLETGMLRYQGEEVTELASLTKMKSVASDVLSG